MGGVRPYGHGLSLLSGWLPLSLQVLAGLAVLAVALRRGRRSRGPMQGSELAPEVTLRRRAPAACPRDERGHQLGPSDVQHPRHARPRIG